MKQRNDLSMVVAEIVTAVATGVGTAVTSARRRHYRNVLCVVIVVMCVMFAIAVLFWKDLPGGSAPQAQGDSSAPPAVLFLNYLPGVSAPKAQGDSSAPAPAPAKGQWPEPTPLSRDHVEELRRHIRENNRM